MVEYFLGFCKDGSRCFIAIVYEQAILESLGTLVDVDFPVGFESRFGLVMEDWVKEG